MWRIHNMTNTVKVSPECAKAVFEKLDGQGGFKNAHEVIDREGHLYFNPSHFEHQDYVSCVLDVLTAHKVSGEIIFGSLDGDNRGKAWGYQFVEGKRTRQAGKLVPDWKAGSGVVSPRQGLYELANTVGVTPDCAEDVTRKLNVGRRGQLDVEDVYYEGHLYFEPYSDTQDYVPEVLDVLAAHGVSGEISFGWMDVENQGRAVGYRFVDGVVTRLKGDLVPDWVLVQ
jgi:hypothetical protein